MSRSYASVLLTIWNDRDWRRLPMIGQWLFTTLISQPDINRAGVLSLAERRWSRLATGVDRGDIEYALRILVECRFIVVDEDTEECLVRSFVRRDAGLHRQANVLKSALQAALTVQSPRLRAAIAAELRRIDVSGWRVPEGHQPIQDAVSDAIYALSCDPDTGPDGPGSTTASEGHAEPYDEAFAEDLPEPPVSVPVYVPSSCSVRTPVSKAADLERKGGTRSVGADEEPPTPQDQPRGERPPELCARARRGEHTRDQPCRDCRDQRQAAGQWDQAQTERTASARARRRALIAVCRRCDENGMAETDTGAAYRCGHIVAVPEETTA